MTFDMYAGYIIASYGITVLALAVLSYMTWRDWQRAVRDETDQS